MKGFFATTALEVRVHSHADLLHHLTCVTARSARARKRGGNWTRGARLVRCERFYSSWISG